jgi:hypothetical protein
MLTGNWTGLLDSDDRGAVILQHACNFVSVSLNLQLQTFYFKFCEFNIPEQIILKVRTNLYNNILNVIISDSFSY